jgi:hypothetical protein
MGKIAIHQFSPSTNLKKKIEEVIVDEDGEEKTEDENNEENESDEKGE